MEDIKRFQFDSLETLEKYILDAKKNGNVDFLKVNEIEMEIRRRRGIQNLTHWQGQKEPESFEEIANKRSDQEFYEEKIRQYYNNKPNRRTLEYL